MKTILLMIGLMALSTQAFSQDLIIKNNGERIRCKIINEDSTKVNIRLARNDKEITTYLNKAETKRIVYEKDLLAETFQDSIITEKSLLGDRYYHMGKMLTPKELTTVLKKNAPAYDELKKAKTLSVVGMILSSPGAFMVGWSLGAAVAGKEMNGALLAVGGGLVAVSIPLTISAQHHAKKAVNLYNKGIETVSLRQPEFKLGIKNMGVSLAITF